MISVAREMNAVPCAACKSRFRVISDKEHHTHGEGDDEADGVDAARHRVSAFSAATAGDTPRIATSATDRGGCANRSDMPAGPSRSGDIR